MIDIDSCDSRSNSTNYNTLYVRLKANVPLHIPLPRAYRSPQLHLQRSPGARGAYRRSSRRRGGAGVHMRAAEHGACDCGRRQLTVPHDIRRACQRLSRRQLCAAATRRGRVPRRRSTRRRRPIQRRLTAGNNTHTHPQYQLLRLHSGAHTNSTRPPGGAQVSGCASALLGCMGFVWHFTGRYSTAAPLAYRRDRGSPLTGGHSWRRSREGAHLVEPPSAKFCRAACVAAARRDELLSVRGDAATPVEKLACGESSPDRHTPPPARRLG